MRRLVIASGLTALVAILANAQGPVNTLTRKEAAETHVGGDWKVEDRALQIWDYQPSAYNTGSLVGSVKASPTKIIPGEWNRYEIRAEGDHFVIVLNGNTVLDAHDLLPIKK